MKRSHSRSAADFRPLSFQRNFTDSSPGSVLVSCGRTRVLCTASIQEHVPMWMQGQGRGWLSSEYSMLPGSTKNRKPRDRGGRIDGRSQEIQRLIGRALRAVVDLQAMPEVTIWLDCDVLSADGGTRTTSINGACIALYDALTVLQDRGALRTWPMRGLVSAISVGMVRGEPLVDLDYDEDSSADVDLNVVTLSDGKLVEIQGSAEGVAFSRGELDSMVDMATDACERVREAQKAAIKDAGGSGDEAGAATPEGSA